MPPLTYGPQPQPSAYPAQEAAETQPSDYPAQLADTQSTAADNHPFSTGPPHDQLVDPLDDAAGYNAPPGTSAQPSVGVGVQPASMPAAQHLASTSQAPEPARLPLQPPQGPKQPLKGPQGPSAELGAIINRLAAFIQVGGP